MEVTMDSEMITQTEDIVLRFRTSKPLGLLLISSTVETGDRIELAVAAGRIRMALRLGVKEKKQEDREKDKVEICLFLKNVSVTIGCLSDSACRTKCQRQRVAYYQIL
jgi:hypothetical protein